ncbi:MAG: hypothetical protein IKU91_03795 [Anaerotignum sp.]|nr:hypothetical protein [Anaerotignum sp.]
MMEEIRQAVIGAVSERFQVPVYGQYVPQGGRKPCFTVELQEVRQKPLLGKRAERTAVFEIGYHCGENSAMEVTDAAEGLYECLLIIGKDERFAASGMEHEKTAEGLRFQVSYEYHIIFTEDAAELMGRLRYNGEDAVGYEEKDKIQQGTAE